MDNVEVPTDKTLDSVCAPESRCWGDEDSRASGQQPRHDPGRALAGGRDGAGLCTETQLLLEASPEKTVQKGCDAENLDSKRRQQDPGEDRAQRGTAHLPLGQRAMPEMKKNTESSQIRLKWPPEGSTLKAVPERSGTDSEEAEHAEEERQKKMSGKRRKRSPAETQRDPEFAWFLPKWPPDGSTFVRSEPQSFSDQQK